MLLLIDNNDSFTYNLVHLIGSDSIDVVRVSNLKIDTLSNYSHIIISPGPGKPSDYPIYTQLLDLALKYNIPILGVCLGHQIIVEYFGGVVGKAPKPVHGKEDTIICKASKLFNGLPASFKVVRYHSLVAYKVKNLNIIAHNNEGLCMAVELPSKAIFGVQFHPESILTQHGKAMIQNFLSHGEHLSKPK